MIAVAQSLHDIEIVVYEKQLSRVARILLVNLDERVDPALIVRLGEVPVKVILPRMTTNKLDQLQLPIAGMHIGGQPLLVNDFPAQHSQRIALCRGQRCAKLRFVLLC